MQLYLIRHAESENNAKPAYQRVEDPPITAVGRLQAERLSLWTHTLKIDVLITSPFRRTLQTTRYILDAAPQTLQIWHDVFERGGCFRGHRPEDTRGAPGLGRSEIREVVRQANTECLIDESIDDSGWWSGKTRESDQEAVERAKRVNQRLIDTFGTSQQTVVIVTHADFKRLLLDELIGDAVNLDRLGLLRNTGVSKLNFHPGGWEIDWLNAVTHLPGRLVTGKEY
ncbi:MAG: histidine phosphatase family protein [Pirellulaceae bacterium]|nr:histidine phosphatase family protein [Pirellulaceae bacterium]